MKTRNLLLAASCGILFACSEKDYYNPNYTQELYEDTWENKIGAIDPNQDWNMFRSAAVKVTVNEDLGQTYTVKLYTANPLDKNSGAMLIAQSEIKSGETYSDDVVIPNDLTTVWVSRVDSHKRRLVKPVAVSNQCIETVFGATTPSLRSADAKAVRSTAEVEALPYTTAQIKEFMEMEGGVDLTMIPEADRTSFMPDNSNDIGAAKGVYYVPAGKTIDWYWAAGGDLDHSKFKTGDVKLIIAGTVNLKKDGMKLSNAVEVIIANGGTLNISDNITLNFEVNTRIIVMPDATMNAANANISIDNGSAQYRNYIAGTVNVGTWNNNFGTTYNCGEFKAKNIQGGGAGSTFINSGVVKVTGSLAENSEHSLTEVINNCHFEVDGSCAIQSLTLGNNAQLTINGTLYATGGTWNLGNYSIVKAKNFSNEKTDIIGPTESSVYALMQIEENVTHINYEGWPSVSKGYIINNIYIEIKGSSYHNISQTLNGGTANGNDVKPKGNGNTCLTDLGESPLWISADKLCTKGNTPKDEGGDEDGTPLVATYAFEDLGSIGDYDFNDVVLQVAYVQGSQSKATVTLAAIGGTKPVTVLYKNETLWEEVHAAYGVSEGTMVNTGIGASMNAPEAKEITLGAGEKINNLNFSIAIVGGKENSTLITLPTRGKAPQALCIPYKWEWPSETTSIIDAYGTEGHAFGDWNSNATQSADWYKYPVAGMCYGN